MNKKSNSESDRYRQTRKQHSTETAEDYVEAVYEIIQQGGKCRIQDLADHFHVSHVTVTRIVSRLQNLGLLVREPYRPVELTASGKKLAIKSKRKHQVVYEFLLSLGVDEETARIDSEGIEHHVSNKTLNAFKQHLKKKSS